MGDKTGFTAETPSTQRNVSYEKNNPYSVPPR